MRKLLIPILGLVFHSALHSQDLPNASFENWNNQVLWSDPIPFGTLNSQSFANLQSAGTIKSNVAHGGNHSARMQAQGVTGSAVNAAIFLGNPGSTGFDNPIPFSGRPDSLEFYANYSIADGDQASVIVMLLLDGVQVGNTLITITGTSSGFVRFSSAIAYLTSDQPNQLGFAAFSTNMSSPNTDSYLMLDDVGLVYNGEVGDQIPGGDFENWTDAALNNPDGWSSSNIYSINNASVTSSTDAISGLSARIESLPVDFDPSVNMGFIVLKDILSNDCQSGTLAFNASMNGIAPMNISGFYKYIPVDGTLDSASVYLSYDHYDSNSSSCVNDIEWMQTLPPTSDWTAIDIELPIQMRIAGCEEGFQNGIFYVTVGFSSTIIHLGAENPPSGPLGSVLYLDDLNLISDVCENIDEASNSEMLIYPNPATNKIVIDKIKNGSSTIQVIDLDGRIRISEQNNNATRTVDISSLPEGTYTLKVLNGIQIVCKPFVKLN